MRRGARHQGAMHAVGGGGPRRADGLQYRSSGSPGPVLMVTLAFLLRWVSPVTVGAVVTHVLGWGFFCRRDWPPCTGNRYFVARAKP